MHDNSYNRVADYVNYNATLYNLLDHCPIHIHDWYMTAIISNNDLSVISSNLNKRISIYNNPQCEIESYYTLANEVNINNCSSVCTRDIDAF